VSSDASKSGVVRWFTLAMATAGGAGFAPVAPGTFGSAVGVALFAGLVSLGIGMLGLALAIAVVFAVGCWASGEAERRFGKQDDGRIVIDEVAGRPAAHPGAAARPALRHGHGAKCPVAARRLRPVPAVRHLEARSGALGGAALLRWARRDGG
jgi:hypothetical protein